MATYLSTLWVEAPCLGTSVFLKVEVKVNWEPWPATQTSNSVGCTPSLQIEWCYRHALFQADDLASQLFHLPPSFPIIHMIV